MRTGSGRAVRRLLLILFLAVALSVPAWHLPGDPQPPSPVRERTNPGVTLEGVSVGALGREELREIIARWAAGRRLAPVDAYLDPVTGGAVPGLNGLEVDEEATLERVWEAGPGQFVDAAYRQIAPAVSLEELPLAPVYAGNPARNEVSFVINVAWGTPWVPQMLAVLEKHRLKAGFFLTGRWVENNPEVARTIVAAGHELGNHAYSDPHMAKISPSMIRKEIADTGRVIARISGSVPRYFSPPYGEFNHDVLATARKLGYLTVLWSVTTADYMKPGVATIRDTILRRVHPGAIILMHPTEETPRALDDIIVGLRTRGYGIVPLSVLLSPDRRPPAHGPSPGVTDLRAGGAVPAP